jgi:hypothetical protein
MKEGRGLPEGAGWVIELRGYTYFGDSPQFVMQTLIKEIARKGAGPDQSGAGNAAQPVQPAPEEKPAPVTPAPAPAPTPAADAQGADADEANKEKPPVRDPAKEKEAGWNNVIRGHVSHPFIYLYKDVENAEPGKFEILGGSVLDSLVGTGSSGGAGTLGAGRMGGGDSGDPGAGMTGMKRMMGMGRMGGGGGASAGGAGASSGIWGTGGYSPAVSIGSGAGGAGNIGVRGGGGGGAKGMMGGGMMGGAGMEEMMRGMRSAIGRRGGMAGPGAFGSPVGGIGVKPAPKKATPTRTEFIIIFVWKEWTPSDNLIKGAEVAPSTGQ